MSIAISIWSDIACPWCFVGKQRLEQALQTFSAQAGAPQVSIRWRAFELDPSQRSASDAPYAERLATKYGTSVEKAQQMIDNMTAAIHDAGGPCDFNKIKVGNTFAAHQLIQWAGSTDTEAKTSGAQHQLTDALMRGYLGEGLDIDSRPALLKVVANLGLDAVAAAAVLETNAFADAVRGDEQEAQHHGISGVPFFVIGRYGVSGAQEAHTLVDVLNTALAEQQDEQGQRSEQQPAGCSNTDKNFCNEDGCE